MNEESEIRKKPSRWWYLLPIFSGIMGGLVGGLLFIFLGIIVGIIGYFLFKDKDRKFAERLLIIGIVATIIGFITRYLIISILYLYLGVLITEKISESGTIAVVDSYCSDGTVTILLTNVGTKTIPATQQTCIQIEGKCSGKCVPIDLEPDQIAELKISGCTLGKFHRWKISGPSSSITVVAYCTQ